MNENFMTSDDMVRRNTVSFEDDLYRDVEALADRQQRSIPNLLVFLAAEAVRAAKEKGEIQTDASSKQ